MTVLSDNETRHGDHGPSRRSPAPAIQPGAQVAVASTDGFALGQDGINRREPNQPQGTQGTQRGKAATEAVEPSYTSGPDDHAGRRAVMALTRCEGYEKDKKSVSEFARSLRAISTIAVQRTERKAVLKHPHSTRCATPSASGVAKPLECVRFTAALGSCFLSSSGRNKPLPMNLPSGEGLPTRSSRYAHTGCGSEEPR